MSSYFLSRDKNREIGSEFWNVPSIIEENAVFPKTTEWFISGRSALSAIINDIKQDRIFATIAMPYWCCESMIFPFVQNGISVSFYDAFNPPKSFSSDAVLVMDYFGYSMKYLFENYHGIVIRDVTHSIFSRHTNDADYYFGSLRKWAGFYTGGYACGFKHQLKFNEIELEYINIREEAMKQKECFIYGYTDSKEYLMTFSKAESMLDDINISPASERDVYLAKHFDIDAIKTSRRRNAQILLDAFSDIAIFPKMEHDDCPLFVPIHVNNRNELRKWMTDNKIYCPVHWPISEYHKLSEKQQLLYDEELSLVCDQRYNESDMQRIIKTINAFTRGR